MEKNTFKPVIMFIIGFSLLVVGIALILLWWPAVVVLFRGAVGIILALAGLLTLYAVKELK